MYNLEAFSIFTRFVQSSPLFNSRTFSSPQKETLYPLAVIPHSPPPSPGNQQSNFLSLHICLLWAFHNNGVIYVAYLISIYLSIYLWLRWVFVAARGLSLVVASGGYSSLQCTGFSLRWLLLSRSTGSGRTGFSSSGTRAQ